MGLSLGSGTSVPLLQPGPQPSLALTLALESSNLERMGINCLDCLPRLDWRAVHQTQTSGRCSLARLGKFVARCFKQQLDCVVSQQHELLQLWHDMPNALRAGYCHALMFAFRRSAQQQRPENLPTHRRPASGWPEPEPVRPFPPPRLFLSLTTTLPTLLSAAAFCHTDDLRYGMFFKAGLLRLYRLSYSLAVTCTSYDVRLNTARSVTFDPLH
jgi:hypothetical protein